MAAGRSPFVLVNRVPVGNVFRMSTRAGNPVMRIVMVLVTILLLPVTIALLLIGLIIDILLLPFRLLAGRRGRR